MTTISIQMKMSIKNTQEKRIKTSLRDEEFHGVQGTASSWREDRHEEGIFENG